MPTSTLNGHIVLCLFIAMVRAPHLFIAAEGEYTIDQWQIVYYMYEKENLHCDKQRNMAGRSSMLL
jgi:hypothetical protein